MSQAGDRIADRYELEHVAGEGGMATVWRAQARGAAGFSRVVAVKEIKSEYGALQSYIDMFVEEARVGSDLAHPNIVQVYDFLEFQGRFFLVMEWVEGIDLGEFVASYARVDQATPWPLVTAIGIHALRGLAAAHSRRRPDGVEAPVIHRDVSPTNILLSACGTVKITDFGLARARDRVYSLTAPGTVKGKLSYLSPEVTYGRAATPKSDQFSLGSVLWEALTGQQLFVGANDIEIFKRIRACDIPPLTDYRPDVPPDLANAIHRALARKPAERFPSSAAMIAVLIGVLDLQSHTSPWELEDDLAQAVARARTDLRPRLPLPADSSDVPPGFDPDGDPTETGPAKLLGGGAVVEFVEYSDSEDTTMPEYLPDGADPEGPTMAGEDPGERAGAKPSDVGLPTADTIDRRLVDRSSENTGERQADDGDAVPDVVTEAMDGAEGDDVLDTVDDDP